jgi:predicted nucleic acid-binding Zn ribbon protein
MGKGPEPLAEILSRLFTVRGWGRRQGRLRLEQAWAEAAGEETARHTRVGGLRRGVMEVEVGNSVLLQELAHFNKRRLLENLRARLPEITVADLRFRLGKW